MAEIGNLYDNGPISPVAKIKENLSIWTSGQWTHYRIDYIEGLPRSSPMMVEMVTASAATTIAANGTIGQLLVNALQLTAKEFMHLRWEPIDDMEGVLWEQSSQGRFSARSVHARVNLLTHVRDPYLATTTFFIMGKDKDMNLEVRNPAGVAMPLARFIFFGYRYILTELTDIVSKQIEAGQTRSTWIPAEGRQG